MEPMSGCWLWTAATKEYGYGVIGLGSRKDGIDRAHRVSWKLHRGDIPSDLNVLHRCGVAACVNPNHLYLGTLKDNARDTIAMGRQRLPDNRGERAKWAKLSAGQAIFIRSMKGKEKAVTLARQFNVSRAAVYQIWCGANWRSV